MSLNVRSMKPRLQTDTLAATTTEFMALSVSRRLIIQNNQEFRAWKKMLLQGPSSMNNAWYDIIDVDMQGHDHNNFMCFCENSIEDVRYILSNVTRCCSCVFCLDLPVVQRKVISAEDSGWWYCVACDPTKEDIEDVGTSLIRMISERCKFNGPTMAQLMRNIGAESWGITLLRRMNYEPQLD